MESTGKEPLVLTATSLPPVQVGEAEANDSEALSPELTQMFQAQNINGGRSGNNLVPAHSEDFADMQAVPDFCSGTEKKLINPWDEKAKLGDWNVMDPGPTQAPFLPSSLGPSPPSQTEEEIMRMFPSATDVIKRNPANPVSVSQRETADSSANMLFQPGDLGLLEQAGDGLSGLGKGLWGPGGGRDSASLSLNPGTRSDSKHSGHGAHGIHLPEERYPEFSAPDPMDGLPRPAAEVEVEELEEHDKTTIFVLFNGLFFPVSWYADTNGEDVKAAVLCSCDAIGDSGFKLRQLRKIPKSKRRPPKAEGDQGGESPVEVVDFIEEAAREKEKAEAGGDPDEEEEDDDDDEGLFVRLSADEIDRRFAKDKLYDFEDFDKLEHGGLYSIEKCSLREDLKKHTVDRWRRLRVLLEPFSHVETQKAISRMQRGTNLLKHTRYTSPHIRHFQLSSDCERLVWYSSKRMADTMVNAADIHGILLGQQTKNFQHYKIPALEHLSFSILYGPPDSEKTLDLTCKDEFEFDHWVTGMKAIIYKKSRKKICKAALLSHSRRFRLAIERNHVAIKLASIPEVKERTVLSLDDCLDIHALPPAELEKKVAKLQARLKTASALVNEIERKKGSETSTANTQSESEEDVDFGLRFAYESVFTERTKAEDEEMQVNRMYELVDSVTAMLQEARNKLIDIGTSGNAATGIGSDGSVRNRGERNEQRQRVSQDSKAVDSLLWRVEVDLENIEDMRQRWGGGEGKI
uniref:PH domain-containing protein n=1 Tax=Chromera velia CCMP2878 TaxID=1169474 RepID=A0A0G4HNF8_9ALVE|eukprot:Cvel_29464.t1-p1 / transcript=Cvel_29464.t1 / gene=Cvel_29464 / organism=Chromera_velia_CCMP2878 / gene_product=hypothetical protein / transcript_product=hypothetical protein / location=Cvel_scaffold4033:3796-11204(+) / protein_length=746 / sequence_SO=supercontig / SO=protein_coding / is_pseudo=false